MRSMRACVMAAAAAAAGGWCAQVPNARATTATAPPFAHYQVILDRQPFGQASEAAPAAAAPEVAQLALAEQTLARQIRLCAVTRTEQGVAAGIVDGSANPPRNLYLYVGDSSDGISLVAADVDAETAEIRKDGASLTFTLSGVKTAPAAPSSIPHARAPFASATPFATPPRFTIRPPILPGSAQGPSDTTVTYIERLKKRREDLAAQNAANSAGLTKTAEMLVTEAAQAALRKRNLDMIRRGEGSLGIPLTAEEDALLVKEGVLPAAP